MPTWWVCGDLFQPVSVLYMLDIYYISANGISMIIIFTLFYQDTLGCKRDHIVVSNKLGYSISDLRTALLCPV